MLHAMILAEELTARADGFGCGVRVSSPELAATTCRRRPFVAKVDGELVHQGPVRGFYSRGRRRSRT
jgi:hypothetical protein